MITEKLPSGAPAYPKCSECGEPVPPKFEHPKATRERPWEYRWVAQWIHAGGGIQTEMRGRWVVGFAKLEEARDHCDQWIAGDTGTTRIVLKSFVKMTKTQAKRENAYLFRAARATEEGRASE